MDLSFPPSTVQRKAICAHPRVDHLAAVDPFDSSPPAAASAAGGWGIGGSRCVYSVGRRRLLAGGAVEMVASPEWLLQVASFSSVVGAPVELRRGSAAFSALPARRSPRVCFPLPGGRVAAAPGFEDLGEAADVTQAGVASRCRMEVPRSRGPSTSRLLRGSSQSKRQWRSGGGVSPAERAGLRRRSWNPEGPFCYFPLFLGFSVRNLV